MTAACVVDAGAVLTPIVSRPAIAAPARQMRFTLSPDSVSTDDPRRGSLRARHAAQVKIP
jgi:hypothetical protein